MILYLGDGVKNEYGIQIDQNGYAPSVVQDDMSCCYLTFTSFDKLDRHEIFHGPYRDKSKRLGLWVLLSHDVHMRLHQQSAEMDRQLKRIGQQIAMNHYGWSKDDFIKQFGKNYL